MSELENNASNENQPLSLQDTKCDVENNEATSTTDSDTFKRPIIIGQRKGRPTKVKTLEKLVSETPISNEQNICDNLDEPVPTIEKPDILDNSQEIQKETKLALPYTEPSWSGLPDDTYQLEVLKSGIILETIDLSKKCFHVVGRLPNCDISMAHPTISRYHAIFQYRKIGNEKNAKGLYIYDLGSTHGTFWNGNRIRPNVFVPLKGGHMVKFGCSQRKFIIQAPLDDQEEESEYSVTQLKEMRKLEIEERERMEKLKLLQEQEQETLIKEKEENEGIDWGMGEDADEETDLTENPYAQTNNEELFLNDPKKTLRGWFEREGQDMQYQTEDKGVGRFLCWVDLPIDSGKTVRAEALVTGKKKEAVVQCALEACRILDRYGLLRQANHEARKRKTKNWEEDDFYDSDEDNFLDRTGTIEKKREQRMRHAGKLETKPDTYDSLLEKHKKTTERIHTIESTIDLYKSKQNEGDDENEDALDAFMSSLKSSTLNKMDIRKLKIDLINLRKEEMNLIKLINIAKPASLPPLKPCVVTASDKKNETKNFKSAVSEKRKIEQISQDPTEDSKKDDVQSNIPASTSKELINDEEIVNNVTTDFELHSDKVNVSANTEECKEVEGNQDETESLKKKKKNLKRNQQRLKKSAEELQKNYDENAFRENYEMWVPPENQKGDGKTSLNAKFGY